MSDDELGIPEARGHHGEIVPSASPEIVTGGRRRPGMRKLGYLSMKQFRVIEELCDTDNVTQGAALKKAGVTAKTFNDWMKEKAFLDVLSQRRFQVLQTAGPRVDRAMINKAIREGKVSAMRLYYEKMGELATQGTQPITIELNIPRPTKTIDTVKEG